MAIERRKFQGVLNILSFNRHFYVFGLVALALIIASYLVFNWSDVLFWIITSAFVYGLVMPLIVSAYVYDFSGYYKFEWLEQFHLNDSKEQLLLNINAGFDETSFSIKEKFPQSDLNVFDFYNAKRHTEPAIVRARKVSMVYPNTQQIETHAIPVSDGSVDVIFLLSAIHEIRSYNEKVRFLKECRRVCKPQGNVIMVEKAFLEAGFSVFHETKFTPFMSIFNCQP
jgi:SAM-dependent methyltransferase